MKGGWIDGSGRAVGMAATQHVCVWTAAGEGSLHPHSRSPTGLPYTPSALASTLTERRANEEEEEKVLVKIIKIKKPSQFVGLVGRRRGRELLGSVLHALSRDQS